MKSGISFLMATIGRKYVVGISGLGLSLFILAHMAGNLLMFVSPDAYNAYGHALISNPLIYLAEAGLIAIFVGHLVLALYLAVKNRSARPQKYASEAKGEKATSFIQKTLWHQGVIILVFVVLHLITFKYGEYYETTVNGETVRDLFKLVVEVFQSPIYVGWYFLALLILGYHLSHGVSSAIRTLGFNHPKYDTKIRNIGYAFSMIVTIGFISQPLYMFFVY